MSMLGHLVAILLNLSRAATEGRERRVDARFGTSTRVIVSWREGGRDCQASARLIDISQGGAAMAFGGAAPSSSSVRVCLEGKTTRTWIEADVVGVERNPGAGHKVRLKFHGKLSTAVLESQLVVRRPRRAHRHHPSTGLEVLEGRQLMAAAFIGPTIPVATQVVAIATPPAPSLLSIATDSFLSTVLYSTPGRMASQIAPDGAIGVNATWEAGQSSTWVIEEQRYGADFVQAGLETHNAALVQQGWQILNWGFAKEGANGSFPGTGDAFHSTSMFVEAAARALLLEVQSGAPNAAQLVSQYLPKINASAKWLMTPSVAAKGNANDAPYTHRRYLLADALGEVGALTHDPATIAAAAVYARQGLALQTASGMNPELGGGDSSYQAYGILLAERYLAVCPDAGLRSQLDTMIVKGLQWEEGFINASGQVSIAESTRTGSQISVDGTVKTIDYKTIVQAFSVATTLTGDPSFRLVAHAVASGRGWSIH
jgi:hypothetical protein